MGLEERGGENIGYLEETNGKMDPKKLERDTISQKIGEIRKERNKRKKGGK